MFTLYSVFVMIVFFGCLFAMPFSEIIVEELMESAKNRKKQARAKHYTCAN